MKIPNKKILCFLLLSMAFQSNVQAKEAADPIQISGVSQEIEANIRANLKSLQESDTDIVPTNATLYRERTEATIISALQPYGYYEAKVTVKILPQQTLFTIDLGKPVYINTIHFSVSGPGATDPDLAGITNELALKRGEIFLHETYEQAKKTVLSKVIQHGYLNAAFSEHRVEVNPNTHTSNIFLTLQTGAEHHFGKVSFGNTALSSSLLNRYLTFKPGDVYVPDKILTLQSDLSHSDYFSQVNVKPLADEDSTEVPVEVDLTDAKPNQYTLGAGYGTDTGIRGKAAWTRRRLNANGHRIGAQAQVAQIYRKVQVDYTIPGKHPQSDLLKFQAGYFDDEFSDKPSQIYETGVTQQREFYGWERRISLNYHHERFYSFENNNPIESKLILPSITFIQTRRDNPTTPTRGRRIEVTFRGSFDALFSDTSFFQAYIQSKWLHAFNDRTKILLRAEAGFTTPADIERLPLSQRFFAGGDLSLRGYGYRSLPNEIDKNGVVHPVGGAYLGIGSIELVQVIKKPFGVFTFIDAGNAFRKSDNEIAIGTGVGIEYLTKLGPIKIAIAKPLTKASESFRIHATFGPEL